MDKTITIFVFNNKQAHLDKNTAEATKYDPILSPQDLKHVLGYQALPGHPIGYRTEKNHWLTYDEALQHLGAEYNPISKQWRDRDGNAI